MMENEGRPLLQKNGVTQPSQQKILRYVIGYQDLPLHQLGWLDGTAVKSRLHKLTGLAVGTLANLGNLARLRPKKLEKVQLHARTVALNGMLERGWTEEEADEWFTRIEQVRAQAGGSWAEWVLGLDGPKEPKLVRSLQLAIGFDRDIEALRNAAADDDLEHYRAIGEQLGARHKVVGDEECRFAPELWRAAMGWEVLHDPTKFLLEAMYLGLHASIDAEFGAAFFSRFEPRPLFLDIAPVMNKATWPAGTRPRKIVTGPVERLLVLSYALLYWRKHGHRWPIRPAGPSELGLAGDLDDFTVTKLSRGSKPLTIHQYEKWWDAVATHFGLKDVPYPVPLVATAICWQRMLVQLDEEKLKCWHILSEEYYLHLWQQYRDQYAEESQSPAAEPWPEWLTVSLAPPDWTAAPSHQAAPPHHESASTPRGLG